MYECKIYSAIVLHIIFWAVDLWFYNVYWSVYIPIGSFFPKQAYYIFWLCMYCYVGHIGQWGMGDLRPEKTQACIINTSSWENLIFVFMLFSCVSEPLWNVWQAVEFYSGQPIWRKRFVLLTLFYLDVINCAILNHVV